jgi:AcrR family transcriptional regulator
MTSATSSARIADRSAAARERLLAAANELFYEEGVHTVGIDRVIERAGVAKATLYNAFGSKEELVRAYLLRRLDARKERMAAVLARYDTPRERLVGIFRAQAEMFAQPDYRGCPFINASAESPGDGAIYEVVNELRGWAREVFRTEAAAAGAPDPDALAHQLHMLYDGANVSGRLDPGPVDTVTPAEALISAALDG